MSWLDKTKVKPSASGIRSWIFLCSVLVFSLMVSLYAAAHLPGNQTQKFLPGDQEIPGWTAKEAASDYTRDGLYGHINGGAEIFLQYGFQHLSVCPYKRTSSGEAAEIILEIYRMATPLEAFGIFSVNRAGEEKVSQVISALNWISDSQINLVKDEYFINILGFECEPEELETFAVFVAEKIPGYAHIPGNFDRFPDEQKIEDSSKYLQGPLAATGESVLLQADFWGFTRGTRGYSTRYQPYNSRLILLEFKTPPVELETKVTARFHEFLDEVKNEKGEVWGVNAIGRIFLFRQTGSQAGLSLGEESLKTARARLRHLLGLPNDQD